MFMDDPTVIIADTELNWLFIVQVFVIPVLLPALVGVINRITTWPPFAKRLSLAVLALIAQLLTEIGQAAESNRPYDLWLAIFMGGLTYIVAELTYQGFYKKPLSKTDPTKTLASKIGGTAQSTTVRPRKR